MCETVKNEKYISSYSLLESCPQVSHWLQYCESHTSQRQGGQWESSNPNQIPLKVKEGTTDNYKGQQA